MLFHSLSVLFVSLLTSSRPLVSILFLPSFVLSTFSHVTSTLLPQLLLPVLLPQNLQLRPCTPAVIATPRRAGSAAVGMPVGSLKISFHLPHPGFPLLQTGGWVYSKSLSELMTPGK